MKIRNCSTYMRIVKFFQRIFVAQIPEVLERHSTINNPVTYSVRTMLIWELYTPVTIMPFNKKLECLFIPLGEIIRTKEFAPICDCTTRNYSSICCTKSDLLRFMFNLGGDRHYRAEKVNVHVWKPESDLVL